MKITELHRSIGVALLIGLLGGTQSAHGQFRAPAKSLLSKAKFNAPYPAPAGQEKAFYQNKIFQVAVFSGITAGLILFADEEIDQAWGIDKRYGPLEIPRILGDIGDVYDNIGPAQFSLGLTAASFAGGLIFKDKKLVKTSELLIKSLIASSIITGSAKLIFGRERPYVNSGPHSFNLFKFSLEAEFMSMPSGHATSAFAIMTVLAKQYPKLWVQIPAYTFAVSVAVQRINSRNHWASDVLVGSTVGYLVGSYFVRREKQKSKKIAITPVIGLNQLSLRLDF